MKKKKIEAILPIPINESTDNKFYVAAVAVEKIDGEKTLITDIYRNTEKTLKTPVVRVVLTEKEFANFDYETGTWNHRQLENIGLYPEFINDKTVAVSRESEKLILDHFQGYCRENWFERIESVQKEIMSRKREEKYTKRYDALEERLRNMPQIPEEFYTWCEEELFKYERYIFYKRKGRYAEFSCGCCGETYRYATERANTYEGQFEPVVAVPRENAWGRCEKCGMQAIYKPIGRYREINDKKKCYMIQKYREQEDAMVRYFEIHKTSEAGKIPVYTEYEICRAFFFSDTLKVQLDFQVYDHFTCRNVWLPNNIQGMNSIRLYRAKMWPGSFQELSRTFLKYSGMEQYHRHYAVINPVAYMSVYRKLPSLEMISKMGMYKLADRLSEGTWDCVDPNAVKPEDILKISKSKIKKLVKERGSASCHELLQAEKELGIELREEEEDKLLELGIGAEKIKILLRYMSAKKIIHRIHTYAGINEEDEEDICGCMRERLRIMGTVYADYLSMRADAGYDMQNEIILHPRNLGEEHDKLIIEVNEKKNEIHIKKSNERYPQIKEHFQKISERYAYEKDQYCIRPARSAGEIILEGKTLHHCVGGENYLKEHNDGKGYILFLRPVAEPEQPFITVEIKGTKIIQWHGINNAQPDRKNVEHWLQEYVANLKKNSGLGIAG